MSQRNRWYKRLWRFVRAVWLWVVIVVILTWMIIDPVVMTLVITIVGTILQYAMILAFGILQFVAIFWFMSRSKTVIVLPEGVITWAGPGSSLIVWRRISSTMPRPSAVSRSSSNSGSFINQWAMRR